jgi:hypothetical protein
MPCYQNAGQYRKIKIANKSFEIVTQFIYLGMRVTNQNLIQEEIKRRPNSGDAFYRPVQNFLSSRPLLKDKRFRIYKIINFPVAL